MVSSTEKYPNLRLVISFCGIEAYLGPYQTHMTEVFVTVLSKIRPQ